MAADRGQATRCLGRNMLVKGFLDEPAKRARICMEVKGLFGIGRIVHLVTQKF